MTVWIKITRDEYELIEAIADSALELAKMCGVTRSSVYASVNNERRFGTRAMFKRIEIDEDEPREGAIE